MPLKRLVEVSHPTLELDQLGDLVSTSRCLHQDLLSPSQRYFSKEGKLYVKVAQDTDRVWLEKMKKQDVSPDIKLDRKMNLEEKIETYVREFWNKQELDKSVDKKEEDENSEDQEESSKKGKVIKARKLWGTRSCPGYLRVRNWIKCMTNPSQENLKGNPTKNIEVKDDDPCSDDHSEGCLLFREDGEEERTFTEDSFQDALHYAFCMTFFNDNPGKARRIYTDPAIIFRMYISKYLHSDKEREKACSVLNKAAKEQPKFCKAIRPFLTALQEGNADVTPTKKDYVSLYQGLKEPEEIVNLELEQEKKSELRTGKLQEIMQMWLDKPYFRSVKTCSSLLDTADEKSSDSNLEEDYPSKLDKEETCKNNFKKSLQTAKRRCLKKYKNSMKYHNYTEKVDVTLQKKDIILLCFSNSLHYAGKLRHTDIKDLIETAEKYVKGDTDLMQNNYKIMRLVLPLIKDLLEERNKPEIKNERRNKERKLQKLTALLENALLRSHECSNEINSLEEIGSENNTVKNNVLINETISTKNKKYKSHKINFSLNELRNYIPYNSNSNLCSSNSLKYNNKFEVLVCKKYKKLYPIPKFYMYGRWSKYSEEELQNFLKMQDPTCKKHDYIIQYGSYVLKGEEKILKKCLLSLKMLGIDKKDLNFALLLYAKIQFKDTEESTYDELIEQREKFKVLNDEWTLEMQMKDLEERIIRCNNVKQESWLINDPDYQTKTFTSGKQKRKKRYETFFNSNIKIKEESKMNHEKSLNDDLEDYRYYNYNLDHNFLKTNDYSSEEGDENENHFLDNLCSCGMAKEEYNLSENQKNYKKIQIEYHYGNKGDKYKESYKHTETDKSSPIDYIKLTSFRDGRHLPVDYNNYNSKKIDYISTDSMLQLHSVFDHGIHNFNRDHVAQVVDFIKASNDGGKAELSLNVQEIRTSEPLVESRANGNIKICEASDIRDTVDFNDINSLEIAEEFLKTEYYKKDEILKLEKIFASEQVLPIKYLERVFNYVQKFP